MTEPDTFALIGAERLRLADALDGLGPDEWESPSRCSGWSVHVVAAHLNAPWFASLPTVMLAVARARSIAGGFDRVARQLAEQHPPAACVAGLRSNADSRFTPPGFGPQAPLTDVIVHGSDILVPLGRSVTVAPDALAASLDWLARGRAKGFVAKGRVDGLTFEATDLDRRFGSGTSVVSGPAAVLCDVLCGRTDRVDQITGGGAAVLLAR